MKLKKLFNAVANVAMIFVKNAKSTKIAQAIISVVNIIIPEKKEKISC